MKTAKLVKKHELQQTPIQPSFTTTSQVLSGKTNDTVRQWIKEYQQTRYANPRTEFAALFVQAA